MLRLPAPRRLEVGALGTVALPAGRHAYAGSARGPGGVRARLLRHLRGEGARHWHVDHLRAAARPEAAWWLHGSARVECRWAAALAGLPAAERAPTGFGASDCGCEGHLVRLPDGAGRSLVAGALEEASRGEGPLHRASAADLLARPGWGEQAGGG